MSPRRLATVLRELRAKRGWTQEELAKKSKVKRTYIAVLEAGHKKNPSLDILKKLARALEVDMGELIE